ncbi:MAG: murein biosynthesis integral membrane protein MurJ [Actinomycetes bacterium]
MTTSTTTTGSASSGLLRSSAVMAAGTVVSRLTGFLRSAVLAAVIAFGPVSSAFQLANTVPNILYILLAGGALNSVLVPQVVRAMKRDADGGIGYAQRLITLTLCLLAGLAVVATLAAPLIAHVYATTDVAAVTAMAYWCLPQIAFYGLYTVVGQVLNARGNFGPMMWAPILNNLVAIAATLLFAVVTRHTLDLSDPSSLRPLDIALLAGGATLGIAVQALALVPILPRVGIPLRLRFDWRGVGLGEAGRAAWWTVLFVAANQVAYLVIARVTQTADAAFDSLGYGAGFSAYSNAYLLFVLPHSILTVSLVTALSPRLAALATDHDYAGLRDRLDATLRSVVVVSAPFVAAFVALGPAIAEVALGYGKATPADTAYLGLILAAFGVGLIPFSCHYTVLRGFYALRDTRTPLFVQLVIAGSNVVLALTALALPAGVRAVGVAFGWSLSYLVGLLVSRSVLLRRLASLEADPNSRTPSDPLPERSLLATVTRAALAAVPPGLAAVLLSLLLRGVGLTGYPLRLLALLIGGAVVLGGYLALARVLHLTEVEAGLAMLQRRVPLVGRLLPARDASRTNSADVPRNGK